MHKRCVGERKIGFEVEERAHKGITLKLNWKEQERRVNLSPKIKVYRNAESVIWSRTSDQQRKRLSRNERRSSEEKITHQTFEGKGENALTTVIIFSTKRNEWERAGKKGSQWGFKGSGNFKGFQRFKQGTKEWK